MNKIRKISVYFFMCLTVVALTTLSGCSTIEGFGEDVEQAGDSLEDTAERASR